MTSEASRRVDASEYLPSATPIRSPLDSGLLRESANIEVSDTLRADLLDLDAWRRDSDDVWPNDESGSRINRLPRPSIGKMSQCTAGLAVGS